MDLQQHSTKQALNRMVPAGIIAGGSFLHQLPPVKELSSNTERRRVVKWHRAKARDNIIEDLLDRLELANTPGTKNNLQVEGIWPKGYTGSLTHKGTVVLGVVLSKNLSQSIGIDLELNQSSGDGLSYIINKGEAPPGVTKGDEILAAFSAKESAYKAYCSVSNEAIVLSDIKLSWEEMLGNIYEGKASYQGKKDLKIKYSNINDWCVTTALHY